MLPYQFPGYFQSYVIRSKFDNRLLAGVMISYTRLDPRDFTAILMPFDHKEPKVIRGFKALLDEVVRAVTNNRYKIGWLRGIDPTLSNDEYDVLRYDLWNQDNESEGLINITVDKKTGIEKSITIMFESGEDTIFLNCEPMNLIQILINEWLDTPFTLERTGTLTTNFGSGISTYHDYLKKL